MPVFEMIKQLHARPHTRRLNAYTVLERVKRTMQPEVLLIAAPSQRSVR